MTVDLLTEQQYIQCGCPLWMRVPHIPGGTGGDSTRLHKTTQHGTQLKGDGLFISGIFH